MSEYLYVKYLVAVRWHTVINFIFIVTLDNADGGCDDDAFNAGNLER